MTQAMTVRSGSAMAGWVTRSASVLVLSALGCSAGDDVCDGAGACRLDGPLEVATWWGTRGELYASFDVLRQSYRRETRQEVELAHRFQNKGDHTEWVDEELGSATPSKPPRRVLAQQWR